MVKYLIWTFSLAYIIQIGAAYFYNNTNRSIGQLVVAAMMFIPVLGVLLSGARLKDMGWKPQIRKNIKTILIMLMLVKSNTNALKAIMPPMKRIAKYCLKTQKDCHKPDLNVLMDTCTKIILMGMSI